jgi:hypothetical protein
MPVCCVELMKSLGHSGRMGSLTCWTKLLDSGRIKLYCGRCAPSDRLEGTKVGERNEAISQAATRFYLSNLGRDEHAARTGTDKLSNEWKGIV